MCVDENFSQDLSQYEQAIQNVSRDHPIYPLRHAELAMALLQCYKQLGSAVDLERAVAHMQQAVEATSPTDLDYIPRQVNLAMMIEECYARSQSPAELDWAIASLEWAIQAIPLDSPHYALHQANLGILLLQRSEAQPGDTADLDDAIARLQWAARLSWTDDVDYVPYKTALGVALHLRSARLDNLTNLDEAIAYLERASAAAPIDSAIYAECQSDLGKALLSRYDRATDASDLDEVIACMERATQAMASNQPDSCAIALLQANLGIVLLRRYDVGAEPMDLERAIACLEQATETEGSDTLDRARYQMVLGSALLRRYQRWGGPANLERAIAYLERAERTIPPSSPSFAECQADLGPALVLRYEQSWSFADLERAIVCLEQATEIMLSNRGPQANLGMALLRLYERSGNPRDLERSIILLEQVLHATSPDNLNYGFYHVNFGMALLRRYEHSRAANSVDLERAISCLELAVRVISPAHPFCHKAQSDLSTALQYRYERSGIVDEADETVSLMKQATRAAPFGTPDFVGCQVGLGTALLRRHVQSGVADDLDDAIACFQRAKEAASPDSLDRVMCQANLGNALLQRHQRLGRKDDLDEDDLDEDDLDAAISLLTSAAQAIPSDSPFFATCQSSLGGGLLMRYRRSRVANDVEQGIACLRAATQAAPSDIACQTNLGVGLLLRHESLGFAADLEDAIACYVAAVTIADAYGSQHTQWQAYHRLASVLDGAGRLAEAFDAAAGACQRIAAVSGALPERRSLAYLHVAAIDDTFAHALRLALRLAGQARLEGDENNAHHYEERAFQIAEMNKGRWFVALLAVREQALPNAPDENPDLVRQLTDLRGRLMEAYQRDDDSRHTQPTSLSLVGVSITDHHVQRAKTLDLERAYLTVVDQLRATYPELAALTTVAPQPLVVVQQALGHGDVLLELVPLPEALALFVLTRDRLLVDMIPLSVDRLHEWTPAMVPCILPGNARIPDAEAQAATLHLMAQALWPKLGPLLDQALHGWQDPSPDAVVPHLILVPTDPLHRWPLHLLPLPDGHGQLLDRFAVCYAATSDTPHYCLRHPVAAPPQLLALAPSMDLPFSRLESRAIQALAPGLDPREGAQATVEALRASSADARWVVLATHARVGGARDPAGQVLLHDGTRCTWVRPHELIARVRLQAEHLSLTACLAHGTDPEAGDNLVGLTRALLYAGCRSLLTTLWAIDDAEALVLDHAFWEHFILERDSAARCLRIVLRARRDGGLGWLADRGLMLLEKLRALSNVDAATLDELESRVEQWQDEASLQRLGKVVRDPRGVPVDSATLWGAFILHGAPHIRADMPLGDDDMAAHYLAVVEMDVERFGPEQRQWFATLERNHDSIRAVLGWAQRTGRAEIGLRLSAPLWRFWIAHGHIDEGLRWLKAWLSTPDIDAVGPAVRAAALHGAGALASHIGDRVTAERWLGEAVIIRRRLGDRAGTAASLLNLANIALGQRDDKRAVAQFEESLALWQDLGDRWGQAMALSNLGQAARLQGDYERAAELLKKSTGLRRAIEDQEGLAAGLTLLGALDLELGKLEESEGYYTESLALYRMLNERRGQAEALAALAQTALLRGNLTGAQTSWIAALSLYQQTGGRFGLVAALEGLAALACQMQQMEQCVRLYAAAHAARESLGRRAGRATRARRAEDLATARQKVGSAVVHTAWEIGQLLSLEQAEALAQAVLMNGDPTAISSVG